VEPGTGWFIMGVPEAPSVEAWSSKPGVDRTAAGGKGRGTMTVLFEPTAEQRRLARAMAGLGLPQEQIALLLEIDPKTLRKHFRDDLDRGMAEANVKIAQSLFNMATTGGSVAAAIFWMKARAGWRRSTRSRSRQTAEPSERRRVGTNDHSSRRGDCGGECCRHRTHRGDGRTEPGLAVTWP